MKKIAKGMRAELKVANREIKTTKGEIQMNYKITINNPGSHFNNPLLSLEGQEFASRDEACDAIYSRLYDVIDGENGCEMVDCPDWSKFGDDNEYLAAKDKYISDCKNYIFREGYASEDGVSAIVEECK